VVDGTYMYSSVGTGEGAVSKAIQRFHGGSSFGSGVLVVI
jgi:hypothetical protein